MVDPKVTFSEFIEEKGEKWVDGLRIYANVQSPIEERSREDWEKVFNEMINKPITN